MISARDIVVRGVAGAPDPFCASVREVTSGNAVACSAEDSVEQARALMAANMIRHVPVLDRRGRLLDLVSLRSIARRGATCKPHQLTFDKQLASSSGHVRNAEVAKVYLSPAIKNEDVLPAAVARFAHDRGPARWEEAADLYELEPNG